MTGESSSLKLLLMASSGIRFKEHVVTIALEKIISK
jgi:hypothetical protein